MNDCVIVDDRVSRYSFKLNEVEFLNISSRYFGEPTLQRLEIRNDDFIRHFRIRSVCSEFDCALGYFKPHCEKVHEHNLAGKLDRFFLNLGYIGLSGFPKQCFSLLLVAFHHHSRGYPLGFALTAHGVVQYHIKITFFLLQMSCYHNNYLLNVVARIGHLPLTTLIISRCAANVQCANFYFMPLPY